MEKRVDLAELRQNIKRGCPEFNENLFLDKVKIQIELLFDYVRNNNKIDNINVSESVLKKLNENKEKFKIWDEIDKITVQFVGLYDYTLKENNSFLKIKASINFHDNVDSENNLFSLNERRCWNDIWIVTYRKIDDNKKSINCDSCGAVMQFINKQNLLKCEYCGNMKFVSDDWEIIDVDVME